MFILKQIHDHHVQTLWSMVFMQAMHSLSLTPKFPDPVPFLSSL